MVKGVKLVKSLSIQLQANMLRSENSFRKVRDKRQEIDAKSSRKHVD